MPDYIELAEKIIGAIKTGDEIEVLAELLQTADGKNMRPLIERLITDRRNLSSTLTELNFAVDAIECLEGMDSTIIYEEEQEAGAPDFKIVIDDITLWIQVKRFKILKFDNIQRKIVEKIKIEAQKIPVGSFFSLGLSDELSFSDIEGILEFMRRTVFLENPYGKQFCYPNNESPIVTIEYYKPSKNNLVHLTLGSTIGLEARWISNDIEEHLKGSFLKAAQSISWDSDNKNINIIVAESSHYDNIDIGNILFGSECVVYPPGTWKRQENGLFCENEFSNKIAFVIILRKFEEGLFGKYEKLLFVNEKFRPIAPLISELFRTNCIINAEDIIG